MNPEPPYDVRAFGSSAAPDTGTGSDAGTVADERDVARLTPGADVPGLPLGRHQQLREHLMSEIERETVPAPARNPSRPPGGARLRWTLIAPAVAAAVAGAVVVSAAVIEGPSSRPAVSAADRDAAAGLLARAALVAGAKAEVPVRDDQYEYIETWGANAKIEMVDGKYRTTLMPPSKNEVWRPVTGTGEMLMRSGNGSEFRDSVTAPAPGEKISGHPGYRFLESLSTDPGTLLGQLRELAQPNDNPPDQRVFTLIGDILRAGVMPPEFSAALFRAAAELPGVTILPNATDALGRPGVAVAMVAAQGSREEWIFDPDTAELLGWRDVAARDNDEIAVKKGQVLDSTAIVHRGIVDRAGDTPPLAPGDPTRAVPSGGPAA
ncbi:CU044_5270 family protein [Streptodolium elevatio]